MSLSIVLQVSLISSNNSSSPLEYYPITSKKFHLYSIYCRVVCEASSYIIFSLQFFKYKVGARAIKFETLYFKITLTSMRAVSIIMATRENYIFLFSAVIITE